LTVMEHVNGICMYVCMTIRTSREKCGARVLGRVGQSQSDAALFKTPGSGEQIQEAL
jgi:hypothetical protein